MKHFILNFSYEYISEEVSFLVTVSWAILTFRNLLSKSLTIIGNNVDYRVFNNFMWIQQYINKYKYADENGRLLFASTAKWIPPNWLLVFFYCTSNFLLFSLLPLQYCSNLLLIFSAKVFAFQWKNLILHTFSFNWKVAAATATTSFNHGRLRGASASTELL